MKNLPIWIINYEEKNPKVKQCDRHLHFHAGCNLKLITEIEERFDFSIKCRGFRRNTQLCLHVLFGDLHLYWFSLYFITKSGAFLWHLICICKELARYNYM